MNTWTELVSLYMTKIGDSFH